jgi:hypothetical protein
MRSAVCLHPHSDGAPLLGGTVQATPIEGSTSLVAYGATQDAATIDLSTVFTPHAIIGVDLNLFVPIFGANALTMVEGSDDFLGMPFTFIAADSLDINNGLDWTFASDQGDWETLTFDMSNGNVADGYIDFLLTGTFTPKGTLAGFDPAPAELRISLNQTGSTLNWASTMNMVPEPMTMSLLAIGGLAILKRRTRK